MLTAVQMQELQQTREEVASIAGAKGIEDARKLVDEVQQMMWSVDNAAYVMNAAQGIGQVLQDIRTKVAEVKKMQQMEAELRSTA